ncbi:cytochrome D1 domain-containing protein [Brevibacillus dissolubilis]|uniref:cytochrome D1 domain-containing protein n=1 Tax=Brevibacillus dissolubilis TaxID=1844116 RepID=UPI001116B131|nr:cytochrome D1 domain-containing protein [Brevibacillus dissolubilis]
MNPQGKRYGKWLGIGVGLMLTLSACQIGTNEETTAPAQVTRSTAAESRPIAMTSDGAQVITANIDVPTITVVDTKTRQVTAEIKVGKEPRNIALSPDNQVAYVTAMYDDKVDVIDLSKQKMTATIDVPFQPFGIVTSPDGGRLYVTSYRGSYVAVIDTQTRKVTEKIKVDAEPRGLAISADGKTLYVSHYIHGHLSAINTDTLKVDKVIPLAETPEPASHDPKVSQGLPGMVENMTFSPDGKLLWLPHLLTNVDTNIQFESTIFPTVSIVDTAKKAEQADERKHLFQQINITNTKNETEIVSNPADVAFLPDASKAFVVLGGSEDLLTFDLKRGGKATHLLRRIPGDNPRGMVLSPDGQTLYVHNAMSHDLVTIATGGNDPYKKPQVDGDAISLISEDPLPVDVRAGKRIFFSANSDEYAADITGKNWMSCASCHFDGEINGLTLQTPKGPRNTPSNVLATKTGLMTWDGGRDEFADYLHTVQDEMGGMMKFDPTQPLPPDVQLMYDQLEAYLDHVDTFPVPKSPYRQPDGQLTAQAALGEELFNGKAGCITCHATDTDFTDSPKAVDAKTGELTTANTAFIHDVGTGTKADVGNPKGDGRGHYQNPRKPGFFDTPTLRGVWATAPYLHDGSAQTIYDVLVTRNTAGKHGNVQGLSKDEIEALVEYVNSIE